MTDPLDSARERMSDANRAVIAAQNHHLRIEAELKAGLVEQRALTFADLALTEALAQQDRAESHLMWAEEADAKFRDIA